MIVLRAFSAGMMMAMIASPMAAIGQQNPGESPQQLPPRQQAPPPRQEQAQPQPAPQPAPQPRQVAVAATVNGQPITEQEVQASLRPQIQGRQVEPQVAQQLRQQVLGGLIEGRLVEQYAIDSGPQVAGDEVETVIKQFENQLAAQQASLDDYLGSIGHTRKSFENRVEGSLAWQKYQQQQVTPDKLADYFEQNQDQFNAPSLEAAQQEVANALVTEMWQDIVTEMKPKAEIRVTPTQPAEGQPAERQPPQNFPPR